MVLKKVAILVIALFLSLNLIANEENSEPSSVVDKCELQYSTCLSKCDNDNPANIEGCYEKCDSTYLKCLEEEQTK